MIGHSGMITSSLCLRVLIGSDIKTSLLMSSYLISIYIKIWLVGAAFEGTWLRSVGLIPSEGPG